MIICHDARPKKRQPIFKMRHCLPIIKIAHSLSTCISDSQCLATHNEAHVTLHGLVSDLRGRKDQRRG